MKPENTIVQQLQNWAAAVAGKQVLRIVATGTEQVVPVADIAQLASDAMRLEQIVQGMENTGRWKEARVLRTEYCMAGLSEPERLTRLSRSGLKISRASYYSYLASAHAFVCGAVLFADPKSAA